MNIVKRGYGHFLKGLSNLIYYLLEGIILVTDFLVQLVKGIRQIIFMILSASCLFLVLFPYLLVTLLHPAVILLLIFFVVFPLLGTTFVSFLRYGQYVMTEYLFDKSDYFIDGKQKHASFSDYSGMYRRLQEENFRREQEERRRQQEEVWSEVFRQFFEQQNSRGSYQWDPTGGARGQYQRGGQTYHDPIGDFKRQYEQSMAVLGLPNDADIYQIKLAYRKKAKQYHPDLNRSPDATEKFQEVNAAFEFLTDENINRYHKLMSS